jgi:hypothetical protein
MDTVDRYGRYRAGTANIVLVPVPTVLSYRTEEFVSKRRLKERFATDFHRKNVLLIKKATQDE